MNPKPFWFLILSSIKGQVISQEFKICGFFLFSFFLQRKPYVGGYSTQKEIEGNADLLRVEGQSTPAPVVRLLSTNPNSIHQQRTLSHLSRSLDLGRTLVENHWKASCLNIFHLQCFVFFKKIDIERKRMKMKPLQLILNLMFHLPSIWCCLSIRSTHWCINIYICSMYR